MLTSEEKEQVSMNNNGMLIKLSDSVEQISNLVKEQISENRRIHSRIDETQQKFTEALSNLKDNLASRGKLSWPVIATCISLATLSGGIINAYITMRLEGHKLAIDNLQSKQEFSEQQRLQMRAMYDQHIIAANSADAESKRDRYWLEKLQDEVRHKLEFDKGVRVSRPIIPNK